MRCDSTHVAVRAYACYSVTFMLRCMQYACYSVTHSVPPVLQCMQYVCLVQDEHEADAHGSHHDDAKGALQEALDRFVSYVMPHRLLHTPSTVKHEDTVLFFAQLYAL